MALKVLFIGGTGVISSASSTLAVEKGIELFLFNRGNANTLRPVPAGAQVFTGDINNPEDIQTLLAKHNFDVVVNWIAYHPHEVARDIQTFSGRVGQYVFISSASAYQKPPQQLPVTEETPLDNPFWEYSRQKQACEELLFEAHHNNNFPATIVRPSHTYDKTMLPFSGGFTVLGRMLQGKPVIIHGDGTSLWVLTHNTDFAKGFVGLLGRQEAIGEAYHITSDELLSWNQIYNFVAEAAGVTLKPVYVPSTVVARYDSVWGDSLVGDKSHSMIFDNSKIKTLVPEFNATTPYKQGAQETAAWYLSHPEQQQTNPVLSATMDKLADLFG